MQTFRWDTVHAEVMSDKIWRKVITGEKAMVAQVFISKGGVVKCLHYLAPARPF